MPEAISGPEMSDWLPGPPETVLTAERKQCLLQDVPATTTHRSESSRKEALVATTLSDVASDVAAFLAEREEWKALGCPSDHPYALRCAEVAAEASRPAIAIRRGDTYEVWEL